ncbi:hypothetical protein COB72_05520 [bacterium]|nr:MAG: hypothetical protein COB72_05520 [bacterium]
MIQNTGPTKLPVIVVPILVASIIAITGYVLFGIRYGAPIREANSATKRVLALEEELPGMIQAALQTSPTDQTVSQESTWKTAFTNRDTRANPFDPDPIVQRQDQLGTTINQVESRISQLENTVKALQLELSYYRQSSPEIQHQPIILDQENPSVPPPQISSPPETIILASDTKNDVQVALHRAWTTDSRIILEATITKLSSEDGYFAIENYSKDSVKKRVITADGINISGLRIQQQGKSEQNSASCDLIPGISMKFTFYFSKGDIPAAPFMARRIEFVAYTDSARKIPLLFQFDNVVISE